ncbi:MAG TPA: sialate O-acetylesterase [Chryseolinea sp.]|nr:sialate O-acetylesterase [Chryseolinea sp.]
MVKKNKLRRYFFSFIILVGIILTGYCTYRIVNHRDKLLSFIGYRGDRVLVDKNLLHSDSTAVILTMGQSNAASFGEGNYVCRNDVYEYFKGDLIVAKEPLLGAFGNGGCSVWTRVSDMLIDSGYFRRIILVPIGIGSSSIQCWDDGDCNKKLKETLNQIRKDQIKITHIIWHQGETDNFENTPKAVYKHRLNSVLSQIRQYGIDSDFFVCIASYNPPQVGTVSNALDTAIQNAQIEFAKEVKGVKLGANTDSISLATDRFDGVHFSRSGLDKFAIKMYYKLIQDDDK